MSQHDKNLESIEIKFTCTKVSNLFTGMKLSFLETIERHTQHLVCLYWICNQHGYHITTHLNMYVAHSSRKGRYHKHGV